MFFVNAIIVIISVGILTIGLLFAFRITQLLRNYNLARPWMILTTLISFFFFGFVFIAIKFLGYDFLPFITLENLVTAIFFFGAVFVLILSILNYNLMVSIFGEWVNDKKTIRMFSNFIGMPYEKILPLIKTEFSTVCDNCDQVVNYSIPNIVRSHPHLNRGVVVDRGMGIISYRMYVRHYCGKELREIPVSHDSKLEYRSQSPSRPV